MAVNRISIDELLGMARISAQDSPVDKEPLSSLSEDAVAKAEEEIEDAIRNNYNGTPMVMPLLVKRRDESDYWLVPLEPAISVTGKNVIVTRSVSKSKLKGSVKEYWAQDDYSITIRGKIVGSANSAYPKSDVQRLIRYCEAGTELDVQCRLLELFGIEKMVINSFEFPFTKGENNQHYVITATSDSSYDLFINLNEEENNV
ncbi:MAG: DUF6046 domain-containing protein [Candidatus Azobacteroides sp.]|nr:DUF6046 domain-containing protein [Candidatus Azobacteroides sp.]